MTTVNSQTDEAKHHHPNHGHPFVTVELNGSPHKVQEGAYTGRTLKLALGVPAEHELDLVVHGEFKPVANDDPIKIKGGEKFVSHCGQGQSS